MAKKMKSKEDLLLIKLGTAGIGRQSFRAWIVDAPGAVVDRQDGDDSGTSATPGDALRALADKIDEECAALGFARFIGDE